MAVNCRAHGLPAISLGWGLWDQASAMTGGLDAADLARLGREGVLALSTAEALELFDTAMIVDEPFLAPARIDLTALRAHAVAVPPMFSDLASAPTRRQVDDSVAAAKSKSALAHRLHGLPEAEQHAVLLGLVRLHIATVLGNITPEAIDPDKAFQDLGFDSLTAVEMRNRLKSATGLSLSPTLIFDYPTPNRLASYIRTELAGLPQEIKHTPAVRTTSEDPIAIVGMACRYPGGVNSPDDMWDMLIQGRDVLSEFPADRGWDLAGLYNPDPDARVRATPAPAALWTGSATSTPPSSGWGRARPSRWIHSIGCCWSCPGRRWSGPVSIRPDCAAAPPGNGGTGTSAGSPGAGGAGGSLIGAEGLPGLLP